MRKKPAPIDAFASEIPNVEAREGSSPKEAERTYSTDDFERDVASKYKTTQKALNELDGAITSTRTGYLKVARALYNFGVAALMQSNFVEIAASEGVTVKEGTTNPFVLPIKLAVGKRNTEMEWPVQDRFQISKMALVAYYFYWKHTRNGGPAPTGKAFYDHIEANTQAVLLVEARDDYQFQKHLGNVDDTEELTDEEADTKREAEKQKRFREAQRRMEENAKSLVRNTARVQLADIGMEPGWRTFYGYVDENCTATIKGISPDYGDSVEKKIEGDFPDVVEGRRLPSKHDLAFLDMAALAYSTFKVSASKANIYNNPLLFISKANSKLTMNINGGGAENGTVCKITIPAPRFPVNEIILLGNDDVRKFLEHAAAGHLHEVEMLSDLATKSPGMLAGKKTFRHGTNYGKRKLVFNDGGASSWSYVLPGLVGAVNLYPRRVSEKDPIIGTAGVRTHSKDVKVGQHLSKVDRRTNEIREKVIGEDGVLQLVQHKHVLIQCEAGVVYLVEPGEELVTWRAKSNTDNSKMMTPLATGLYRSVLFLADGMPDCVVPVRRGELARAFSMAAKLGFGGKGQITIRAHSVTVHDMEETMLITVPTWDAEEGNWYGEAFEPEPKSLNDGEDDNAGEGAVNAHPERKSEDK